MAALTALATATPPAAASAATPPQAATGNSEPLHTALPPTGGPTTPAVATGSTGTARGGSPVAVDGSGVPAIVQAAYLDAQHSIVASDPGCHLSWTVLAGIGQVESGQADDGDITANGTTRTPILGPVLDGTSGNAAIPASSGGGWARAEGPMQFIPSTWAIWGADGNGDGIADPNNVFDAALAAGHYLCANGRDLSNPADLDAAILSYNDSPTYLTTVTAWITYYQHHGTPAAGSSPFATESSAAPSSRPTPSTSPTHPTTTPTPTAPRPSTPATPSRSASPTGSPTTPVNASPTATPSGSPAPSSPVCSPTSSPTPTSTGTGTATATPSNPPTTTPTPTGTSSPTTSPTPSGCPSSTATPTPSKSATPSP